VGIELTNHKTKDEGIAYYSPGSSRVVPLQNSRRIGSDRACCPRLLRIVGSVPPYTHIPSRRPIATASRDRSMGVTTGL